MNNGENIADFQPPFEAYSGEEPYIFASYSHKDKSLVYPEICRLHKLGFRIWYDEGIYSGKEWPEEVAIALIGCSFFLVFISPRSVDSKNVRNEINFALKHDKQFLQVYIEETKLPVGLDLQTGSYQAIYMYTMSEEIYHRKMHKVLSDNLKKQEINAEPSKIEVVMVAGEAEKKIEAKVKPTAVIENSIGMEFVLIPAGEFQMGSNEYDDEKPIHKVKISKPFYLGKYPVTQKEWKAVMGSNSSNFKGDNRPAENVSWNDVQEFVNKLNSMDGTDKYSLPSEAEWEYACRAGTSTRYPFGDSESHLGEYAWYNDNSGRETHPVGQKKNNPWGLYDMHGNVWEWVQDKWHQSYKSAPADGSALENQSGSGRVVRGGGWSSNVRNCRSAFRYYFDPGYRHGGLGFRLLRKL